MLISHLRMHVAPWCYAISGQVGLDGMDGSPGGVKLGTPNANKKQVIFTFYTF